MALKLGVIKLNPLFPDKIWNYKNFNMGAELDISGEFIYDGIHALNQMNTADEETRLFSFLYHTSVGIERIQKIIIVLCDTFDLQNYKEFEDSLITHSHTGLQERVFKLTNMKLIARENRFLQMLTSFYNSARYDRFNLNSQYAKGKEFFCDFLVSQIPNSQIKYHAFSNEILITSYVKEILGRIVGSISKKYYELICEKCRETGTYTYELRTDSKAEKIFLSNYKKNSLQMQKNIENMSVKELLIYLRNSKDKHPFLLYMDEFEHIEFDPAFLNEYISEISNGNIPQALVDEVESLYEENGCFEHRKDLIEAIGNPNVDFEQYAIHKCFLLIGDLLGGNKKIKEFAKEFIETYEFIDEDYGFEVLSDAPDLCKRIINEQIPPEKFVQKMQSVFEKIKVTYNY